MWVKICGMTNLKDALAAARAGANAVGFVFAPSPRRVTVEQVAAMTARLPRTLETYGVFVDADFGQIASIVEVAGLTGVQLHAAPEPGLALRLREHFAAFAGRPRLGILQVLHFRSAAELAMELEGLRVDHALDAVLVDSRAATAAGGTGRRFDWVEAAKIFRNTAPHLRLLAAGGLSPENVTEAVTTLRPWGVDVVSGVEATPGRKHPERVRAFVTNARAAHLATR